jgi:hypothetical protein
MTLVSADTLNSNFLKCWILKGSPTGSNTFTVNCSTNASVMVASYTGTDTSGTSPDNHSAGFQGAATLHTISLASVSDNGWHIAGVWSAAVQSAGTATTLRVTASGLPGSDGKGAIVDNNAAITPAGNNDLEVTSSSASASVQDVIIAPFVSAATNRRTLMGVGT